MKFMQLPTADAVHPHGCGEHTYRPNRPVSDKAVHPHGCGEHGMYREHGRCLSPVHPRGGAERTNPNRLLDKQK